MGRFALLLHEQILYGMESPGSSPPKTSLTTLTSPASPLAAVIAFIGCSLFALSIPPIPDHAYQFHIAARYLDGARLYVDVAAADMHPPLFTWVAALFVVLGRVTGVDGLLLFSLFVSATIAVSLHFVWKHCAVPVFFMVVAIFAMMSMAGPYFGQGDQLAVILSLPYLVSAARGADGREQAMRSRIAVAFASAFGLAMKPHFALVWVGVEAWLALRRGARSLLRLEAVTIGVLFVLYVAATAVVTPEFYAIVPWALALYPRFAPVPLASLIFTVNVLPMLAGLVAGRSAAKDPQLASLANVLTIAMLAMYVAVVLQGKGWGYHWYPVNALAVMLCGLALSRHINPPHASSATRLVTPLLAVAAIFVMNLQVARTARLLVAPPGFLPAMIDATEQHAKGGSVIALSHTLNVAFPLVNMTGVSWPLPYAHLWMVPAMYADAWAGRERFRYRETGPWRDLESVMFDRVWNALEREPDAMLVIPMPFDNGFDMRAYFETDPRFRARFAASAVVDTVGYYVVLKTIGPRITDRCAAGC